MLLQTAGKIISARSLEQILRTFPLCTKEQYENGKTNREKLTIE